MKSRTIWLYLIPSVIVLLAFFYLAGFTITAGFCFVRKRFRALFGSNHQSSLQHERYFHHFALHCGDAC